MYHNLLFKSKLKYTKEAQVSNIRLRRFENKSIVWFKNHLSPPAADLPIFLTSEMKKIQKSSTLNQCFFLFTFVHSLSNLSSRKTLKSVFSPCLNFLFEALAPKMIFSFPLVLKQSCGDFVSVSNAIKAWKCS